MKQIYILALALVGISTVGSAQTPCDAGRYSTELFPAVTVTSGVQFGNNISLGGASTDLFLDIYEPTGDTETERPLIVWAHGGSFIGGSRTDGDVVTLCNAFAKRGFVCISIDYRLGLFPPTEVNGVKAVIRSVQDMKAAVRFFYEDRATANMYKIDTNNIIVGGSSAGAITALHMAYLDDECEIEPYITVSEFNSLGGVEGTSGNPGYSSTIHGVINLAGALASYGWLEAGDVPFCSLQGDDDSVVPYGTGFASVSGFNVIQMDGSRILKERALAVGVQNNLYTHYGADHAPYAGNANYMDTTINFVTDFLVDFLGCTEAVVQPANTPTGPAVLYALTYCGLGLDVEDEIITGLFPNPSEDIVHVEFNEGSDGIQSIELVDILGRVLHTFDATSTSLVIAKSDYGTGTYFVRVTAKGGHSTAKKFIFR
ncbi:MAG: T9SS type A sorting domain-containing protein [Crocinitomicaceae bacterium]|nr:T9SS type A sorting domain-containing protein [Crocinitomicaceae bacterium]